jgi:hypothetical protein
VEGTALSLSLINKHSMARREFSFSTSRIYPELQLLVLLVARGIYIYIYIYEAPDFPTQFHAMGKRHVEAR